MGNNLGGSVKLEDFSMSLKWSNIGNLHLHLLQVNAQCQVLIYGKKISFRLHLLYLVANSVDGYTNGVCAICKWPSRKRLPFAHNPRIHTWEGWNHLLKLWNHSLQRYRLLGSSIRFESTKICTLDKHFVVSVNAGLVSGPPRQNEALYITFVSWCWTNCVCYFSIWNKNVSCNYYG